MTVMSLAVLQKRPEALARCYVSSHRQAEWVKKRSSKTLEWGGGGGGGVNKRFSKTIVGPPPPPPPSTDYIRTSARSHVL